MDIFLDIECNPNYFLVKFRDERGKMKEYEMCPGVELDANPVRQLLAHKDVRLVTFNGNNYDMPMLTYALSGADCRELYEASKAIIEGNLKPWQFYRKYDLNELDINHVDLIEIAPGMVSLKLYGGRLHCKRLQDLPYGPHEELDHNQMYETAKYCGNDLDTTAALRDNLDKQITLRENMSKMYAIDLRSKSDAQIAEAVLKSEFERITGRRPTKVKYDKKSFYYEPPEYIQFHTEQMREVLDTIVNSEMVVKTTGHVQMPKSIEKMVITIGTSKYKIGIGGLHSQESEVSHYADDDTLLIDRDVTSYYPNLMLNMGMNPPAFGEHFSDIYRRILDERVAAKGVDKVKADSLKIVLNGTFGKTSNKYSFLYNPEMMIRTTLSGQLSLLMLIEMLEMFDIPVVSANTDGVVIKCPVEKKDTLDKIIAKWEKKSNLNTEETRYRSLHSRDVNNYIGVTVDGEPKIKGIFATPGISKNPQNQICAEAVIAALKDGTPLKKTVTECEDFTKFVTVRRVTGGAVKDEQYLGKAIRWYYAEGVTGTINYKTNGNVVPRSEGAKPCMELPDEFPDDVNYKWYLNECKEMLMSLGVITRPVVEKVPRKNSKAWKALKEEGKIVEGPKGKYVWA